MTYLPCWKGRLLGIDFRPVFGRQSSSTCCQVACSDFSSASSNWSVGNDDDVDGNGAMVIAPKQSDFVLDELLSKLRSCL